MKSNLVAIISRLLAMTEETEDSVQTRRFENNGELRAEVTYDSEEKVFILKETATGYTTTFDDIDDLAMDIYDLVF
ncbi:MAG: YkuJ family protein [Streptococcaceae bacterium]|jgi:uncharacterized protein YkuJ|nr:YkuJ family protein [Streptococcaceae bacterium]